MLWWKTITYTKKIEPTHRGSFYCGPNQIQYTYAFPKKPVIALSDERYLLKPRALRPKIVTSAWNLTKRHTRLSNPCQSGISPRSIRFFVLRSTSFVFRTSPPTVNFLDQKSYFQVTKKTRAILNTPRNKLSEKSYICWHGNLKYSSGTNLTEIIIPHRK